MDIEDRRGRGEGQGWHRLILGHAPDFEIIAEAIKRGLDPIDCTSTTRVIDVRQFDPLTFFYDEPYDFIVHNDYRTDTYCEYAYGELISQNDVFAQIEALEERFDVHIPRPETLDGLFFTTGAYQFLELTETTRVISTDTFGQRHIIWPKEPPSPKGRPQVRIPKPR